MVQKAMVSPEVEYWDPGAGLEAAAVCQAVAAWPATEDAGALRAQALHDLRRLFAPAGLAILQANPEGLRCLEAAWGLPVDVPGTWPADTILPPTADAAPCYPATFGRSLADLLEAAGLRIAWCLRLPDDEQAPGTVLLFYPTAAAQPPAQTLALAQLYVQQLGLRLANVSLRLRLRAQSTQLEAAQAVSEISAALNSHLGEPDVLQLIADRAKELLACDGVAINLLEPDGRSVRTMVVSGEQMAALLNRVYTADRSMAARVTLTGEPLFWDADDHGGRAAGAVIRTALVHPLTGPFGPIGSIGVLVTGSGRTFTPADMRLLELFARQAALAITNGRMLERSRLEATFQTTFNQIIEALLLAHSDDEVQARLVETAARLIPCESCYFAVFSSDLTSALVRHAAARPGAPDMRGSYNPEVDWPDLLPAILRGDLIYWARSEATDSPGAEPAWRPPGVDSAILVPVLYRGWLLGVLAFTNIHDMPNWLPLTPDLLRHLAAQVASALTTARLYEETREHLAAVRRLSERLHALNNVSVQIQAALHPDEVYAQTFAGLRSLGLHAVVTGVDDIGTGLRLIAHSFTARETTRATALGIVPPPGALLPITAVEVFEQAIRSHNVQFCDDMLPALGACFPDDSGETLHTLAGTLGVTRGVIAPLIARDRLLGLLVILGDNLQRGDEAALAPLASQAAIALDKAALYEAMLAAHRFSESLIDSMSEGLAVVDTDGRHMLANQAFCDMVGYRAEELDGQLPPHPYWPSDEFESLRAEMQKLMSGGHAPAREVVATLRRRDGSHFHAGMTPGEVHDERGRVTGLLVIARDLTERERLEAQAAQARAAREADRLKSELLATVSHELRTPLAAIKGFTSTMLRYGDRLSAEEQREFLQDIEEASDRLAELVGNLLNMSRLEASLLNIESEALDLAPLVREETAGFLPRCKGRKQQLILQVPESLAPVFADPRRMRQVLANLLDNAAKYTPAGGRIVVRAEEEESDVLLVVADSGPGIPSEHLEQIFEPFHRVDSRLTRTVGGTGLGLAITRRILDAQGGRIEVQSAPGAGATFLVRLPIMSNDPAVISEV